MRVNNAQNNPIQLQQEDIKEVDKFVYLGSVVSKDGSADQDIQQRINKARHTFNTLRPIWKSTSLSCADKIRIFNTNVKSVLLYGSETRRVTKQYSNKLQTFVNKCLRNIKKIRWPEKISNTELWNQTNQQTINEEILKRKWGWIRHTLRKPVSNITRQALFWNPQGNRKVGCPRHTWRRSTDKEAKDAGMSWEQLKKTSQNRMRWWSFVAALCSRRNQED